MGQTGGKHLNDVDPSDRGDGRPLRLALAVEPADGGLGPADWGTIAVRSVIISRQNDPTQSSCGSGPTSSGIV